MMRFGIPRPHRAWLIASVVAVIALVATPPLLRHWRGVLTNEQRALQLTNQRLTQNLSQLREDAAMAQQLGQDKKAAAALKKIAPVDRAVAVTQLEPLAAEARFTSFTYTLSPEQPVKRDGMDVEGLAQSALTLTGEAPHDAAVYRFLERLCASLKGRAELREFSIDRMNANNATPLAATNVRMNAVVEWIYPPKELSP